MIDRGENRGNDLPIPRAAVAVEIPAGDPENPVKKKMINDTVKEQEINGIQRTGVESPVPRGREDKIAMKDPGKIRRELSPVPRQTTARMLAPGNPDVPARSGMKRDITNDRAVVANDRHGMRIETVMRHPSGTTIVVWTRRVEVTGRRVEDGLTEIRVRITIRPKVVGTGTQNPIATSHARSERRFQPGAMRLRG